MNDDALATLPISVVIPAFNRAHTLRRALLSVARQLPARPAEVIVVDDNSSDDTVAIARAFGAKVVRHGRNQGPGAARNSGIEVATQQWVAFLDSDDEWMVHHLAAVWRETNNFSIVTSPGVILKPDSVHGQRLLGYAGNQALHVRKPLDVMRPENVFATSGTLARRDQVLSVGGFSESRLAEDLDLWMRLVEQSPAICIPHAGHWYHTHDHQTSVDGDAMRVATGGVIEQFQTRSWFKEEDAAAIFAAHKWDQFRSTLSNRRPAAALKQAVALTAQPSTLLKVPALLRSRRMSRDLGRAYVRTIPLKDATGDIENHYALDRNIHDKSRTVLPVSVVIPMYNRENEISRAILSVLTQCHFRPAEVIVVDDGSTDRSIEVARSFPVTVVEQPSNTGQGEARNAGARAASQEWVAFLDSDDEWLPNHLEAVWRASPGNVLVSTSSLSVLDGQVGAFRGNPRKNSKEITSPSKAFLPENPISTSGTLMKREVLWKAGGFRTIPRAQDLDLWIRALEHGAGVLVPTVTHLYHVHPGQISFDPTRSWEYYLKVVNSFRSASWWNETYATKARAMVEWDNLRLRTRSGASPLPISRRWLATHPSVMTGLVQLWFSRLERRRKTRMIASHGIEKLENKQPNDKRQRVGKIRRRAERRLSTARR